MAARSERTRRSRTPPSKGRAEVTSSVASKRVDLSRRIHKLVTPVRKISRRVSRRLTGQAPLPSPAPYQYTPLNDELQEIRLLILHEGDFSSEVSTSINVVPLHPDRFPTYEALSYVWGSTKRTVDISVDNDTLAVTKNLAEALKYLRYEDRPRTLWIDAICVNQQDLEERSRQVRRMADLYRLADRVVVWLGPQTKISGHGLKILKELSSKLVVDWHCITIESISNGKEEDWGDKTKYLPYGDEELRAIHSLVNRRWFERLWIWQEIRLAKSNAIMMCGSDTISWMSFRTALC